jgi:hypothetical protein
VDLELPHFRSSMQATGGTRGMASALSAPLVRPVRRPQREAHDRPAAAAYAVDRFTDLVQLISIFESLPKAGITGG